MNTKENKVWEGEGQLWHNLSIGDDGMDWVLHLKNATPSYMKDKEIRVTRTYTIQQAIDYIVREDSEYETELGLYSEEG